MARFLDARIPVVFAASPSEAGADDALLMEADTPAPEGRTVAHFTAEATHVAGCACCTGRSAAARALSSLFLDRARSRCGFFSHVLVLSKTPAGRQAVQDALADDVLVSQWFRIG